MDSTELQIYLALDMPLAARFGFRDGGKRRTESFYAGIQDLCDSSEELQFQIGSGVVHPEVRQLSPSERAVIYDELDFRQHSHRGHEAISVSGIIPHSYFANVEYPEDMENRETLDSFLASGEFCKRISDLLVLVNISRVGSIGLYDSAMIQDQQPCDSCHIPRMEIESFEMATDHAEKIGWPSLQVVPLLDVWEWYAGRRYIIDGFDGTSLGRALCAYSRLFEVETQGQPMQLLWALVGLEALYAKGNSDLSQQLREKSQIFLGKQLNFKKKVSQMYNFRSRFVHGDLDFDGISLMADARETFERYSIELIEATSTAIAMLAGTLQEIIRRDWEGLHFEYVVSNSANPQ